MVHHERPFFQNIETPREKNPSLFSAIGKRRRSELGDMDFLKSLILNRFDVNKGVPWRFLNEDRYFERKSRRDLSRI